MKLKFLQVLFLTILFNLVFTWDSLRANLEFHKRTRWH